MSKASRKRDDAGVPVEKCFRCKISGKIPGFVVPGNLRDYDPLCETGMAIAILAGEEVHSYGENCNACDREGI